MTDDLVKRLRFGGVFKSRYCDEAADRIEHLEPFKPLSVALQKQVTELESNIKTFLSGDYPYPRTYRPDQCPHDKYYYEDCGDCDFEYWQSKGFGL